MKTTKKRKTNNTTLLESSIQNLRNSMGSLSMDQFVLQTIESLMSIERNDFLESVEKDKGNGSYERAFKTLSKNGLVINVPRTRGGLFSPAALELLKINQTQLDDICLSLYKKGLSGNDISSFINECFGEKTSPSKIGELSKVFNKFRLSWQNSQLESHYKVVFGDVIFITVRRGDSYSKEGVYVLYGVRDDNRRELLALESNPTEGSFFWGDILQDLKKRGVTSMDLLVADGIQGLEDELMKHYPLALFQKCVIHKMRNILNKIRPKEKLEVAEDLKKVFNNFEKDSSLQDAKDKVMVFINTWKDRYPTIDRFFNEDTIDYYFTYIKFDYQVRRMIYTSNSIENINRAIRKATKNKLSFESPTRLLDYVFMVVKEFEEKNLMKFPVTNYKYFAKIN
jgi:transposase-like protein